MKRLIPLTIIATLSVAGAASAAQTTPAHHARRPAVHHAARLIRVDDVRINHGMSPLALANASDRRDRRSDDDAVLPGPDHPGWLKDRDHAGWGWSDGRAETVVGLYKRNPDAEFLRNSDLIQGGHGAAGLAVSFKLGS